MWIKVTQARAAMCARGNARARECAKDTPWRNLKTNAPLMPLGASCEKSRTGRLQGTLQRLGANGAARRKAWRRKAMAPEKPN
ncbi:MAG: hypothetical protein KGJ78_06425 [Alphaproteobacteria bacterium]|nr:hypothetical protein [Alphaproteobacteria bacterium]